MCNKCHPKLRLLKVPVVWMIGPPGSGKTTQCDKIVAAYGFQHISTSHLVSRQLLNPYRSTSTSILSVGTYGGSMYTDVAAKKLIDDIKFKSETAKGFIVDGYPRSTAQAAMFEVGVGRLDLILALDIAPETLLKRNLVGSDITLQDNDDLDDPDVVAENLARFESVKEGLIEIYHDKVKIINANKPPDEVFNAINKYLMQIDD